MNDRRARRAVAPSTGQREELAGLQLEIALYIESISAELRIMAKSAELDALAYFLEMARLEASIQVERHATTTTR